MRAAGFVGVVGLLAGCQPQAELSARGVDGLEVVPVGAAADGASTGAEEEEDAIERFCGSELADDEVEAMEAELAARMGAGLDLPRIVGVTGGVIDVHFHVIHDGNTGDLSQAEVDDQIQVLNDAFAGTGWEFDLVSTDWTDDRSWFGMSDGSNAENNAKSSLREGSGDDLNIYSAAPGFGILGWSTFPSDYSRRPDDDGVVFHYGTAPGGNIRHFDEGDTLVHEVGHWMGLYHTFQGGCSNTGDHVSDTNSERSANTRCPANRDSCASKPGRDPVENYMDYSYDSCMFEFTSGQDDRMDDEFSSFRFGN